MQKPGYREKINKRNNNNDDKPSRETSQCSPTDDPCARFRTPAALHHKARSSQASDRPFWGAVAGKAHHIALVPTFLPHCRPSQKYRASATIGAPDRPAHRCAFHIWSLFLWSFCFVPSRSCQNAFDPNREKSRGLSLNRV